MEDANFCTMCQDECNQSSQLCGRCARNLTLSSIGIIKRTPMINDYIQKNSMNKKDVDVFVDDENCKDIS
jgi:hypothetical protein